jgi:hypothetical protein
MLSWQFNCSKKYEKTLSIFDMEKRRRIQPPLFKVEVSPQTPVGVYTIPIVASMLISTTSSESPTTTPGTATVDKVTGVVDPEFQVSKKYPTIGHITSPVNLTIDVIPPLTLSETFTAFWTTTE